MGLLHLFFSTPMYMIFSSFLNKSKDKSVLEEIDVIVNSLLDVLLRTILEITSCPKAAGSTMQLQFQDVTVSITA